VKPVFKDATGNDTYFQMVPFVKAKQVVEKPFTVTNSTEEKSFPSQEDLKLALGGPSLMNAPAAFVGYGISEPKFGWNDFQNIETKGKVLFVLMGAPMRDGKPVLPDSLHRSYGSIPGARKKVLMNPYLQQNMPLAVFIIADAEHTAAWGTLPDALNNTQIVAKPKDQPLNMPTSPAMIGFVKGGLVETLFLNQPYSPVDFEKRGLENYRSFDLADVKISFRLATSGEEFESMNVVGIVPGTDNSVSQECITLGAHLDHVGPRNGQVCNGADDNASGSIGVLEVAEAIALQPLRRPVIFSLYTAEESGLLGSRYFVSNCPVPIKNITVNINLDMIGRSDPYAKESRKHYVIGSDKTNPELKRLIDSVNSVTVKWPLDFESEDRTMGGSDHMSFHRQGIPVAFFFSGRHVDLHLPTDDAQNIDYEKMHKLAQLVYEVTVELGNRQKPMRAVI
jgi:Zn-dependent M28 family amino/carboxypeptidase